MPKNDIFLAGPRSWKPSNFSTFWKAFKNDENHHQLTTGPLKCAYLLIWVRKMQKCEMPKKWHFSRRSAVMKIFKFFDFLESLLKWWKSPPFDHKTLEMCIFADLDDKYAKMWNAQKWQFVASPRSWKSLNFSTFWKAFINDENHHQLTTGPLKCAYLLIWVRNMQKFEMPKNDIFLAGPQSWKCSNFSTFWKAFKNDENHHQLTTGPLKCAYLLIWVRDMQKCEMPKNDNLLQVCGDENPQIFRLSGKLLKMMKTTTSWPQDPWNVHICWFGWEICKNVQCPNMTICRRSAVMKIFKFFDFLESL